MAFVNTYMVIGKAANRVGQVLGNAYIQIKKCNLNIYAACLEHSPPYGDARLGDWCRGFSAARMQLQEECPCQRRQSRNTQYAFPQAQD